MKKNIAAVTGVLLLYFVLHITGIGCPIRYLTGVSCAGCGMTRAWISFAHMDWRDAFYYHPLLFWPVIAAILYLFRKRKKEKVYRIVWLTLIFMILIIYVVKNTNAICMAYNRAKGYYG